MSNFITPEFRVSYPQLFEKKAYRKNKEKFNVTMLFDKKTDLTDMKNRYDEAAKSTFGTKIPADVKSHKVFGDGDLLKKGILGYENVIFVKASQWGDAPVVLDDKGHRLGELDFYPGCYARASLHVATSRENEWVYFILNTIQKTRDGERFGKASEPVDPWQEFGLTQPDNDAAFGAIA